MTREKLLSALLLMGGLLLGCKSTPETSQPPPLTVAEIDQKIAELDRQRSDTISQPLPQGDRRSTADLQKEVNERKARVKFLQDEIDALLRQRAAAETYYRQHSGEH